MRALFLLTRGPVKIKPRLGFGSTFVAMRPKLIAAANEAVDLALRPKVKS